MKLFSIFRRRSRIEKLEDTIDGLRNERDRRELQLKDLNEEADRAIFNLRKKLYDGQTLN